MLLHCVPEATNLCMLSITPLATTSGNAFSALLLLWLVMRGRNTSEDSAESWSKNESLSSPQTTCIEAASR